MRRSEFLTALRESLIQAADAEFSRVGRSARNCPYILRTIERYSRRSLSALMRLIQGFARPPAGADAQGLIRAVTERTRVLARRIAEKQSPRAQAMTDGGGAALPSHDPGTIRAQLGGGRALDGQARRHMEQSFGTGFGAVRIHEDSIAARFNAALGARAFTIGQHIAFAAGEYRPGTSSGDRLLAHELAHTVQQGSGLQRATDHANDRYLERQADQAAAVALAGRDQDLSSLRRGHDGVRIQRLPAVLAGALVVAEATPEIVIGAELATVTTEVIVVDGALVATADVAVPALVDVVAAPVLESTLPAALEAVAPAAIETTAATSSSVLTTAATVGTIGAVSTLSSDSPTREEQDRRRGCFERFPTALPCEEEIPIEEQVQEFIMNQGYGYESLGNCHAVSSVAAVDACHGAPGESWHCDVAPYTDPIARVSRPGGVVSIFSCLCCRADGGTGFEWRGQHWSPGR